MTTIADLNRDTEDSLPIKVLLWNIPGDTCKVYTSAHQKVVTFVVNEINPDVLLLQETSNRRLVSSIMRSRSDTRKYEDVSTIDVRETRIIYDTNKYNLVPSDKKIFPQDSGTKSLDDVLRISKKRVLIKENLKLRDGKFSDLEKILEHRISVASLRRNTFPESPIVVFISFHNVHLSEGADVRARDVECFCQLVSEIRELTGCVVLAGADFNQQLIRPYSYRTILDYTPTDRRLKSGQIDYFVLDPPNCLKTPVEPCNFIVTNSTSNQLTLHRRRD